MRMLTGSAAVFICQILFLEAATQPPHADRQVMLKQERTLLLLSHGKVINSYKVAVGGDSVGPKTRQGTIRLRRSLYPELAKCA